MQYLCDVQCLGAMDAVAPRTAAAHLGASSPVGSRFLPIDVNALVGDPCVDGGGRGASLVVSPSLGSFGAPTLTLLDFLSRRVATHTLDSATSAWTYTPDCAADPIAVCLEITTSYALTSNGSVLLRLTTQDPQFSYQAPPAPGSPAALPFMTRGSAFYWIIPTISAVVAALSVTAAAVVQRVRSRYVLLE